MAACKGCGHATHYAGQCHVAVDDPQGSVACLCVMGRIEYDAYFTQALHSLRIVQRVAKLLNTTPLRIMEPYCGYGSFVRALRAVYRDAEIAACDIQPFEEKALEAGANIFSQRDLLKQPLKQKYDLIVTNTPFDDMETHVQGCLSALAHGGTAAFLAQASFHHTQDRVDRFWATLLQPSIPYKLRAYIPIRERLSFEVPQVPAYVSKTANTEYVVFVFQHRYTGVKELCDHLSVK